MKTTPVYANFEHHKANVSLLVEYIIEYPNNQKNTLRHSKEKVLLMIDSLFLENTNIPTHNTSILETRGGIE
jgi:hypothetical protein